MVGNESSLWVGSLLYIFSPTFNPSHYASNCYSNISLIKSVEEEMRLLIYGDGIESDSDSILITQIRSNFFFKARKKRDATIIRRHRALQLLSIQLLALRFQKHERHSLEFVWRFGSTRRSHSTSVVCISDALVGVPTVNRTKRPIYSPNKNEPKIFRQSDTISEWA